MLPTSPSNQRAAQQIIGREGAKQLLSYERRPLNLKLREGGFARVNSSDIGKKNILHLNFAFNAFLFISATDKMITPMPIHWVGTTFS